MLKQRTLTALVLFALAGLVLFKASNATFAACSWLMCLIAIYELAKMYQFKIWQTVLLLVFNTSIVLIISKINYDFSQIIRIATIVTWCFAVPLILLFMPQKFGKLTISILSILLFLPAYYAMIVINSLLGPWQLISIMAIAWVADTGAYFVGRTLGKHKLAPKISPGKSIEGAIGGIVLVTIYLFTLSYTKYALYLPSLKTAFKFAIILTIVSIMGDLFESWLKRVAKVKDSGTILPGHGGVFDRIDSLIAVLAIAFAMIRGML